MEFLIPRFYNIPVNDTPKIFEVVGTTILVSQIICVLPYVESEQRVQPFAHGIAGIGFFLDGQFAIGIGCKPYPALTKEGGTGCVELLFELFE